MRRYPLFAAVLVACSSSDATLVDSTKSAAAPAPAAPAAAPARADSLSTTASGGSVAGDSAAAASVKPASAADLPIIRGLYVNRFAAQSTKRMRKLMDIADSTEINAFVIDVKDEFGLNIPSQDPLLVKNAGKAGVIPNVKALMDTLKAHDILPIARIVVFKDSVAARANPDHVIRKADGSAWHDKQGLTWVNPYDEAIWEYVLRVSEEAVKLGFGEIQYDYIRFPEPYKSLPTQVFPNEKGRSKPDVLAQFLKTANARMDKVNVRVTADIFGLVTTVGGPLEIGQEWEKVSPAVDVVLPMTYPSHYPRGAFNIARPNAEPYKIQQIAIARAKARDAKLGLSGERVRPWIQAFSLGQPKYDASHVKEQMRGIYDAGYNGWVWWHPGSIYEPFIPALEKKLVPHAKSQ
ncbi:MAG TPA: putative glycoside hydrolase [Gemmatimonadaceae bacterium]|nr:putative glycoside hydrolase [Gemmatimonadaceae bacterium]